MKKSASPTPKTKGRTSRTTEVPPRSKRTRPRTSRLLRSLRHALLPMHGNNHHPHILKREIVTGVLVCALVLEVAVLAQGFILFKNPGYLASVLPSVVASLTNDQRTSNDLPALTVSPLLTEAAQEKANDMAAKGYFSHVSPDGTLPWAWFQAVGYDYQFAGENLAVNFNDSSDVVNAWMASPEHRANILKQQYTQEGIGMATGMYEGKSTIFVVQFFATPEPGSATAADAGSSGSGSGSVSASAPLAVAAPTPAPTTTTVPSKSTAPVVATVPPPTELMTTAAPAAVVAAAKSGAPAVLGIQTAAQPTLAANPTFLQTLLASPFTTSNDIFVFIAAFALAVLLSALIFRKRLPRMTATIGGLSVVVIVFGFAIINQHYFSNSVSVDNVSVPTSTSTP